MFWPNFFWVRPSKEKKSDYNPRLGPITLVQKKKKKKSSLAAFFPKEKQC